ncbi:MAG: hypothetical protein ACFFA3_21720 [Promethearchaeota archaeon]
MKKKKIIIATALISFTVLSLLTLNYFFIIKPNIYFKIQYNISEPNANELIDRVELFNYSHVLDCSNNYYTCNLKKCYFDRDAIHCFKRKINNDIGFHINPFYCHYFLYHFSAVSHSNISLTYNNNSIFNCMYPNNTEVFHPFITDTLYLNFSMIPYVYNSNSTILLSDVIVVNIRFVYAHSDDFSMFGGGYPFQFQKYLIMDIKYNIILIFVPSIAYLD